MRDMFQISPLYDEWICNDRKLLEENLPGMYVSSMTIFVRIYESRIDLLTAVIIGPKGTPYHDGLFFFDVFFPRLYPFRPPDVRYRSTGGFGIKPCMLECRGGLRVLVGVARATPQLGLHSVKIPLNSNFVV
ncbi:putative ubiquitin-conjugating enzyme E2, ubiquitin-conjugating enzyme/RWD [Helianthus anomalus]